MLLWQGVRKEKCSSDEEADEEADEDEEDEEEEGRLMQLGEKRSQQDETKSCSKKQKVDDDTERKPTICSYDSLLSHILCEKSAAATIFISNLSYAVGTTSLTGLFTSHGFKPTSVRIVRNKDGHSRGLEQ